MSTRGFLGFVADEHETITYSHSDSYPDYLGLNILEWARSVDDWGPVKDRAAAIVHVSDDGPPTDELRRRLAKFADGNVSSGDDWYALLRRTQGDPAAILEAGYAEHDAEWPADSLFCEWGYLLDLDREVLEVYRGFQTEPHADGRFHDRPRPTDRHHLPSQYYPVRLIGSWKLTALPDRNAFLAVVDG